MVAANVFDGIHTAATAASNALYQLLRSPQALAEVRADWSLLPNALAEGLRTWAPVIYSTRYALEDFQFAGTEIPQGQVIDMLWAAGNRDPDVFDNPSHYDIYRKARAETTFGGGIHICPGRYVVRMLSQTVLEAVLAPGVRVTLTGGAPQWIPGALARQLQFMKVTIRRDP